MIEILHRRANQDPPRSPFSTPAIIGSEVTEIVGHNYFQKRFTENKHLNPIPEKSPHNPMAL
jgi:hypothetical protein